MDLGKNKTEHVLLALLACLGVYLFVFMYLQISSIPDYREIKSSNTNSELVQEQVVLTADNIDSDAFVGGEVSAISRDANDSREFSNEDWSESTYKGDPEENAKEIERQLFENTGEKAKRDALQESHDARLEAIEKNNKDLNSENEVSENQFSGNVMVEFDLSGRHAYKKDNWYVRNPGYTCGTNSNGLVVVQIKVNRNGNVTSAQIDTRASQGASECMFEKAMLYAKKSRFNYSSASSQSQLGIIKYRFVSQ
ncbi:hypothetical protein OAH04_00495 [Crocinitomicaceae bacterium]|jgi:anionic cell wall polymer biosynthesis LytR-Cps2A-Psr (LCP) family protein|nr:hypothetical protein [Crocinitomicaceae bacterium]